MPGCQKRGADIDKMMKAAYENDLQVTGGECHAAVNACGVPQAFEDCESIFVQENSWYGAYLRVDMRFFTEDFRIDAFKRFADANPARMTPEAFLEKVASLNDTGKKIALLQSTYGKSIDPEKRSDFLAAKIAKSQYPGSFYPRAIADGRITHLAPTPMLIAVLWGTIDTHKDSCLGALKGIMPRKQFVAELVQKLKHGSNRKQEWAAFGLGDAGAVEHVDLLHIAAHDPSANVALESIKALIKLEAFSPKVATSVVKHLDYRYNANVDLRNIAIDYVVARGTASKGVLEQLRFITIKDEAAWMRRKAQQALIKLEQDADDKPTPTCGEKRCQ